MQPTGERHVSITDSHGIPLTRKRIKFVVGGIDDGGLSDEERQQMAKAEEEKLNREIKRKKEIAAREKEEAELREK